MYKDIYTEEDLLALFEEKKYLAFQGTAKTARRMKLPFELIERVKAKYKDKHGELKKRDKHFVKSEDHKEKLGLVSTSNSDTCKQEVYKVKEKITSLDDFIKIFKPDLEKWKIKRWTQNYWAGFTQVKVEYEAIAQSQEGFYEKFLEEIKAIAAPSESKPESVTTKYTSKYLLELVLPDLHLSKMSSADETGENYNTDEAIFRYKSAVETLLARVPLHNIGKILLVVGNDLGNFDTLTGTTTAGTPQDSDSRYYELFIKAKKLMIDTINKLVTYCPVDIEIVSGNHDQLFSYHVGSVLEAYYHLNDNVSVNNSPKPRKYYQFGKCLIGLAHGDNEKELELPLIMAREVPKLWAETEYREWHLGHFHKTKSLNFKSIDENQGIRVRRLPALTGTDAWHNRKAYHSLKSADAFVWCKNEGMILQASYNI